MRYKLCIASNNLFFFTYFNKVFGGFAHIYNSKILDFFSACIQDL